MRLLIQRVKEAGVSVEERKISSIGKGLLVFAGFGKNDTEKELSVVVDKILGLRVFPDGEKESSLSVKDVGGEILLVSQFTLYGDVRKGRRPSFSEAMAGNEARVMFEKLCLKMKETGIPVQCGIFQTMMEVNLLNDGPYTIWLDTDKD